MKVPKVAAAAPSPHKRGAGPQVRVPRRILLPLWAGLTLVAYYLLLFTQWGNRYHGGTPAKALVTDAAIVFAAFASLEVLRTEKPVPLRAVAAAVGLPLALVALLTLWYGLRRHGLG